MVMEHCLCIPYALARPQAVRLRHLGRMPPIVFTALKKEPPLFEQQGSGHSCATKLRRKMNTS